MHLHWHTEPLLLTTLIGAWTLYMLATHFLRPRLAPGTRYPQRQVFCLTLGLAMFYGAVASPLDSLGETYLFSAHMLQHVILIYPVPVLLLMSLPAWLLRPLLSGSVVTSLLRFCTTPLVAAIAFNLVFTGWHAPALYELALHNRMVHNLEHLTFLGTSLLMWWPLLNPLARSPRLTAGVQTLYLLALSLAQLPVFAYVTFSHQVLYPTYAQAPRLLPLTPLEDQRLGGIIMKGAGMIVLLVILAWTFRRWHREDQRRDSHDATGRYLPAAS